MTPEQALIIMDWAMKFLPLKYRETQEEWFGKKASLGMSQPWLQNRRKILRYFLQAYATSDWLWTYPKWCMMLCLCLYVLRRSDYTQIFLVTTWNYTYTKRRNCIRNFIFQKDMYRDLFSEEIPVCWQCVDCRERPFTRGLMMYSLNYHLSFRSL